MGTQNHVTFPLLFYVRCLTRKLDRLRKKKRNFWKDSPPPLLLFSFRVSKCINGGERKRGVEKGKVGETEENLSATRHFLDFSFNSTTEKTFYLLLKGNRQGQYLCLVSSSDCFLKCLFGESHTKRNKLGRQYSRHLCCCGDRHDGTQSGSEIDASPPPPSSQLFLSFEKRIIGGGIGGSLSSKRRKTNSKYFFPHRRYPNKKKGLTYFKRRPCTATNTLFRFLVTSLNRYCYDFDRVTGPNLSLFFASHIRSHNPTS